MNFRIIQGDITQADADAVIVWATEQQSTGLSSFAWAKEKSFQEILKKSYFSGKFLETKLIPTFDSLSSRFVLFIGLGPEPTPSGTNLRLATAKAVKVCCENYLHSLVIPELETKQLTTTQFGQYIAEGSILGNYQFLRYRTTEIEQLKNKNVEQVTIYSTSDQSIDQLGRGIELGQASAEAVVRIRDLVNEPPGTITPQALAQFALTLGENNEAIEVTCYDENYLKKENYNALLAVAAGSEEPPFLIHLKYTPPDKKNIDKSVAFVGKGVTFDSGGLGIKPWSAMRTMKSDMAGAGTVLGIFLGLLYRLQTDNAVPFVVHGVIPTTENMISGRAMRPDDVIETKSGKTVEVVHTDAEGRLILADALSYTINLKPDSIIDFATLTGAAIAALGRSIAAIMGNDPNLLNLVKQASEVSGELLWELPLHESYREFIKSPVADIQNIAHGDTAPDAIIGGLFLQEFIGKTPWVHIDIAGPSWAEDERNPLTGKGATGWGVLWGLSFLDLLRRGGK